MPKALVAVLLFASVFLSGCGVTSLTGTGGEVVTREEAVSDFDRIEASNGFKVNVSQGDEYGLILRVSESVSDQVEAEVDDGTLRLGLKPSAMINIGDFELEADVTMPVLKGIEASGGSHVYLEGLSSSEDLDVTQSGGSHLNGDLEAGDLTIELGGGSHATLSGTAGNLTLEAGGGSHAKLGELVVNDADVEASGGSHVKVNASGTLNAVSTGGSHVKYEGEPTLGDINSDTSSSFGEA
jgi:hypothetical protein